MINKTQLRALLIDLESDRIEDISKLIVFEVVIPISRHYLAYTDPVVQLNLLIKEELSSGEMRSRLGIKHRQTFRDNYIHPALESGLITQTIPEKPNSRYKNISLLKEQKIFKSMRNCLKIPDCHIAHFASLNTG